MSPPFLPAVLRRLSPPFLPAVLRRLSPPFLPAVPRPFSPPFLPPALRLLRPREPIEQQLSFGEAIWTSREYADKAAGLLAVTGTWRAVVYGAPGSGKSVFAAMAAQGLAGDGAEVVPLVFSLSTRRHPDDLSAWLNRRLPQAYPELRHVSAAGPGGRVARLVRSGRYLFVLDGLDEMPRRMRRWALEEVGLLFGPDDPVVLLTADAGLDNPLPLAGAQHIGIEPAPPGAVADYLDALGRFERPNLAGATAGFDTLAKIVRSDPGGPVAALLSRPLDLSLTVQAMSRGLLWPSDLADCLLVGGLAGAREVLLALEVAGVVGRRWDSRRLGRLARRMREAGVPPSRGLESLVDAGLLRREGRLYLFRHAEIGDFVATLV
ncbi:NACHT domain-containing protein [Actinoplanes sp. LDG1-06]|uniref:NACHT domain-containing protein n=1 Tax=Paractinoplanes ovalisporus TaxID=2810368 RepID=A0ABS2AF52_9ACTN|nr:NACHT domain-containing protein [Actinoplanes ovalisporus]MBM2618461.1 NACHT domain-containing protein [Actinoplanes ovalisporus]